MKISIFGTGYVGLVSGTCLAELGHEVLCVDIDQKKIDNLKNGIIPIYEPGLDELVKRNIKEKRLTFTTHAQEAVEFATAIFSAVGTPPDKENSGKADLKYVKQIAKTIGENMNSYKVLINKSTVPVGTGKICYNIIKNELQLRGKNVDFDIVSNPEFLREGNALYDFMNPDRIVCGIGNETSKKIMEEIYAPMLPNSQMVFTDVKSSEIIKYAANAFLATKISFINEIANFCEKSGGNVLDVSKGIGLDARIGQHFLEAGIGYGGSCFPKDIQALIETGKDFDYDFKIIGATQEVNKIQKTLLVEKLKKYTPLSGIKVGILGLAFKPKTDDIRDAASLDIIQELLEQGVQEIRVFDPVASEHVARYFQNNEKIVFCESSYEVANETQALLLVTQWDEFKTLDMKKIKKSMFGNIFIDGRNIYKPQEMKDLGFIYESIGR